MELPSCRVLRDSYRGKTILVGVTDPELCPGDSHSQVTDTEMSVDIPVQAGIDRIVRQRAAVLIQKQRVSQV